jgi:hypothetical protein
MCKKIKDKMGGTNMRYGRGERCIQNFNVIPEVKIHLTDLGIHRRLIRELG